MTIQFNPIPSTYTNINIYSYLKQLPTIIILDHQLTKSITRNFNNFLLRNFNTITNIHDQHSSLPFDSTLNNLSIIHSRPVHYNFRVQLTSSNPNVLTFAPLGSTQSHAASSRSSRFRSTYPSPREAIFDGMAAGDQEREKEKTRVNPWCPFFSPFRGW